MTNLSTKTRREQVLDALRAAGDGWVNTVDIANAHVGGSAGTSRIRELRGLGFIIDSRPHPDPKISQYQYRLVAEPDLVRKVAAMYQVPPAMFGVNLYETRTLIGESATPEDVDQPYVQWRLSRQGKSVMGRLNDCDLWVSEAWDGWVWRAAGQHGLIGSGRASSMEDGKRKAIKAAR